MPRAIPPPMPIAPRAMAPSTALMSGRNGSGPTAITRGGGSASTAIEYRPAWRASNSATTSRCTEPLFHDPLAEVSRRTVLRSGASIRKRTLAGNFGSAS